MVLIRNEIKEVEGGKERDRQTQREKERERNKERKKEREKKDNLYVYVIVCDKVKKRKKIYARHVE